MLTFECPCPQCRTCNVFFGSTERESVVREHCVLCIVLLCIVLLCIVLLI